MQLNSYAFVLFVAVTLACYYATTAKYRWVVLLAASLAFYALVDWSHLWVPVVLALVAFVVGRHLSRVATRTPSRHLVWLGVAPVLFLLVGYRWVAASGLQPTLVVPLGLSFFSLRLISYLVDVSRGTIQHEANAGVLVSHVVMFPELAAGPIERAGVLIPQFRRPQGFRYAAIASGVKLFAWGLFKKLVIADRLRMFVDAVYDAPASFDGAAYAVATVFFAFQIYCDFSGYSDMAIGVGEMFGLRFAKNFDRPYRSRSVTEFWSRWHISFSSWLRDYLFLPIVYKTGRLLDRHIDRPNTVEKISYGVAAATTMALCGLWHGVSMNYVAWGLVLALFMMFSVWTRRARARLAKKVVAQRYRRIHDSLKLATTFSLLNVSWVFFRAKTVSGALSMLAAMPGGILTYSHRCIAALGAGRGGFGIVVAPFKLGQPGFDLIVAVASVTLLLVVETLQNRGSVRAYVRCYPIIVRAAVYVGLAIAIIVFRASVGTKFIYAGF